MTVLPNYNRSSKSEYTTDETTHISTGFISKQGDTSLYKCKDGFVMLANTSTGIHMSNSHSCTENISRKSYMVNLLHAVY